MCPLSEGVTFAEGSVLESIEEGAFQYADMTSIHFPASLKTIGRFAFEVCNNLEIVTFAEGSVLERVGIAAFSRCGSVAIHLPASVTEIGLGAEHTMNLVFAETEGWVSVHWDTGVESPIDVTKLDELDGNFQDWHSLKRYPAN